MAFSSFRRKPESSIFEKLDTGFRRSDGSRMSFVVFITERAQT
jgi:hypothetical protein